MAEGKICVLCGESCAGLPRIKDPQGRYYHERCHEEAKRRIAEQKAAAAEAEFDLLDTPPVPQPMPHVEDEAPILEIVEPNEAAFVNCPGCQKPLPAPTVVCMECGYNLRSGARLKATKVGADRPREPLWPAVVGVISIVFGVFGVLLNGGAAVQSMLVGEIFTALVSVFLTLLALWLAWAGIGIFRQQRAATYSIRKWAIVKLVVYGLCMVATLGILALARPMFDRMQGEMGGEMPTTLLSNIVAVVIALFGWFLFWPIFILIWFGREKIKSDVDAW